jgi:hypothetical protein
VSCRGFFSFATSAKMQMSQATMAALVARQKLEKKLELDFADQNHAHAPSRLLNKNDDAQG